MQGSNTSSSFLPCGNEMLNGLKGLNTDGKNSGKGFNDVTPRDDARPAIWLDWMKKPEAHTMPWLVGMQKPDVTVGPYSPRSPHCEKPGLPRPENPLEPRQPFDPKNPEKPGIPLNPENPLEPKNPLDPKNPLEPENPCDPENPLEPEWPFDPENPGELDDPFNPLLPDDPYAVVGPEEPSCPDAPDSVPPGDILEFDKRGRRVKPLLPRNFGRGSNGKPMPIIEQQPDVVLL